MMSSLFFINMAESCPMTNRPENNCADESQVEGLGLSPPVKLRIWPAVVVAALLAAALWLLFTFGTTNIHSAMALGVAPAFALLLFLAWWLGASRAPWRDRIAGIACFILAALAITFMQKTPAMGAMLLARALPFLLYGVAALLVVTGLLRWSLRRWALAAFLIVWAGVFVLTRVESIGGNLFPVLSWPWESMAVQESDTLPFFKTGARAVLPETTLPGDWPAFRGSHRDGRVDGVRFSADWNHPPREVWRQPIGSAWSAFILVDKYLFTQEQRGEEELVTCYLAATGEPVWRNGIPEKFEDGMGVGPRATPSYDDGRLYTQGATGVVQCLDAATGAVLWKRDVREDAGMEVPEWGFTSSPLAIGDQVIVFTGGAEGKGVIAYDRLSGEIVWMSGHGNSGYCSPHLAALCGVPQLLMVSNFGIESLDPASGARLWENQWDIQTNPRCTQPVVIQDDSVMLGATGTSGTRRLRVERTGDDWQAKEIWTTRQFRPYFNDGALHRGYYYGFDGERVACLDIDAGRRLWAGERFSGQLLLIVDMDMLLVLSEAGEVVLVPAVPEGYSEKARFKALSGKTWNHPIIGGGKLFVRNDREAVCFELPQVEGAA